MMTEFETFCSYFPEILPPLTLTDESIEYINANNEPIPLVLCQKYLFEWEGGEGDEFTEFVPCLKFNRKEKIKCLVYWKAGLLRYEYIMAITDSSGKLISKKPLCGTIIDGDVIKKSVARIDEEFTVHIAAGATHANNGEFTAEKSQSFSMEISENGEIIFMKES